jgi:lipoprotein-anchoring transpeptidase ErfK/SrfK
MTYRQWPRSRKVAYCLTVAGLVAVACFLVANKGFGASSASAPRAVPAGSTRSPEAASIAAAAAAGASPVPGQTTTTEATQPASETAGGSSPTLTVPKRTQVATLKGDVPGSPAPGAAPTQTVPGSWYGYPSVLPVIAKAPHWLEVRLAQRPNESTAWIPKSDATVSVDHFAIVVDLATTHLTVFQHGKQIEDFPAGIGTPSTPTPAGSFFVTMTVPAPSAGYGPFVLVTSAHSDAITDWDNSGDAIVAIHGPIDADADALIGATGAAVSDGCVRLHDADLAQLADIPPGTPVDVVPS